jgi:hypothetical protein
LNRVLGGPQSRSRPFGDEINLSLTKIQTLDCPASSLVTILNTLSRLLYIIASIISVQYKGTIDISERKNWSLCDNDLNNNNNNNNKSVIKEMVLRRILKVRGKT